MYTLTVHYKHSRRSPTVFERVEKVVRDEDLIWLEFKPPPGWPPGAGAILECAAIKELKIEYETTEMAA